jgi:Tfp pilus assembly protein PilO
VKEGGNMSEKQRSYLLLATALCFGMLAIFYFLYLTPLRDELTGYQVRLAQLEKQEQTLLAQAGPAKPAVPEEKLAEIIETIPVKPYTDQLIKDLGKLQTISHVQLETVAFGKPEERSAKEIAEAFYPKEERKEAGKAQGAEANGSSQEKKPSPQAGLITLEELKRELPDVKVSTLDATVTLKGEYKDLYDFVMEVQSLSRYLRVDELSFTSPEKDEYIIPKDSRLTATVKLTSYFAPQFAPLVDKLPPVDVEGPSGKWNPLEFTVTPKPEE